ncbi:MAG: MFS transporter [Acidobacteriota bacterium]
MGVSRPAGLQSIVQALASRRTAAVALLSFSSGLPLGMVWIAIPDWLRSAGVDIRVVGLLTLAQAPWTFKVIWAPLLDRYRPPFLGRRRGWALLAQIGLVATTLALAGVGHHPDAPWIVAALALSIAFASATQDIAIDAYAVDVLKKEEQGVVVGARTALYRGAMYVAGGLSITAAARFSWPVVNVGLACLYLPMMIITWKAPASPPQRAALRSLKQAVWYPFLGFLSRDRALEILAFVFFYKLADNLASSLLRPFLVDMGYTSLDRGLALATLGLAATLTGTFLGGFLTTGMGLGHSLWVFGLLQIFSNIGYVLVARAGIDRILLYSAMGFESLTQGLGTGAFAVLLLRMTQKRFSATQYALFSSLFGLPRILAGPISGFSVDAMGWENFFWLTMLAGLPGLVLLQRFAPLGVREPSFRIRPPRDRRPLGVRALTVRGIAGGLVAFFSAAGLSTLLNIIKQLHQAAPQELDYAGDFIRLLHPGDPAGSLTLLGILIFALFTGLAVAAVSAARHGAWRDLEAETAVLEDS